MNKIAPIPVESENCACVRDQAEIAEKYRELLGDESRLRAEAVSRIYFPENAAQLSGALQELAGLGEKCVLSAGRTGITGSVAPIDADAIVSLGGLNRLLAFGRDENGYYVRAEPGVSLADLAEKLACKELDNLPGASAEEQAAAREFMADEELSLWFPVDPTEMTAHVGGVVANNASGARTYRYGSTRKWVRGLRAVFADGRELFVRRGEVKAEGLSFVFKNADGSQTPCDMPAVVMPDTKCTAGYHIARDMDLIDLLVGSEGTLCAFAEVELLLTRKPESILGVLAVVDDEEKALALVENARTREAIEFEAIEYFDHDALSLLKQKKEEDGSGSHIPEIPSWDGAAVYLEIAGTEDETEEACVPLEELLDSVGSSLDDTWAAMEEGELEQQKLFRHSVPEAVNSIIGQRAAKIPGLHKIGTDMAVPDAALREVFALYRRGLAEAGLQSVVFGHIGNNHVHVNILPADLSQLAKAKELYVNWAKEVVRLGGAVAAEHGIGRLKKAMLERQYPLEILDGMRGIRKVFDPAGMLAPGVLV
jgi:D-lactate dehydrogenase (cytochrome)